MESKIDKLLKLYNEATHSLEDEKHFERALFILLDEYKDRLPELNYNFHKAFRQMNIIDPVHDAVIWYLLDSAEIFWVCFHKVQDKE